MFMTGDTLIDALAFTRHTAGLSLAGCGDLALQRAIIQARNIAPETRADAPCLGSLRPWMTGTERPICPCCHRGPDGLNVPRPLKVEARWQGLVPVHPRRKP
jgi:hypothetical protein